VTAPASLCVCIPTYNEAGNVERMVRAVLDATEPLGMDVTVLVIDDGSPDGTGDIADRLAEADLRVAVLHRREKSGIGPAYLAGFRWALERDADLIVQMDCDFSHDPADIQRLVAAAETADVVLGSRYVDGGEVRDWPLGRRLISRGGCWYARTLLGLGIRDLTGGFKCFRRDALATLITSDTEASGYGFQIEMTHRAIRAGLRVQEVPIVFTERTEGSSKMSRGIALEAARVVLNLREASSPHRVRRALPARAQVLRWGIGAAAVAGVLAILRPSPLEVAYTLLLALYLGLLLVGVTTLAWMLYAWREPEAITRVGFTDGEREPRLSFSLILPARHEEQVLGTTIARLREQRYPDFEVIVVTGDDDPGTRAVAEAAIAGDPRFRVIEDASRPKNKPKALNTALAHCRGDVVGVFDAEDQVAPDLLRAVDRRFQETGAEVVQGATQLMNFSSSWFSVRNVLEYYFWFKSRLHFHAAAGFIPLGGNTVFVRRDWLEAAGGWDPDCLAEDCDLGSRLSTMGARTVVAYSPDLVTREETPATVRDLVRQRTRWNQGFLQVLRKGEWRSLPRAGRALAFYTLSFPFLQAFLAILLPLSVAAAVLADLPIVLTLLSFLPLVPLLMILAVEAVGLSEFGRDYGMRVRIRDYARLVVGFLPYHLLLAGAACHAASRELRGVNNWEKTAHVGAHL
jgi:cellulose synthase/poly-beta-1,6-N-acetylglucosamine synthase-like glycosyltransferase